ncbi:exported hypothetical protein [Acidobacteriia bacterium SbA2]|nr:exported hypothetical protein [Acidobacteriia bacterium SbA2]
MGRKSNPELSQPRRGGRYSSTASVAPSGAVIMAVEACPTAHAVGYFLPPLRGFHRPRTLRLTLMGQRPGSVMSARAHSSRVGQALPLRRTFDED